MRVKDIRRQFADKRKSEDYVVLKGGIRTIEIQSACFTADHESIFGTVSEDYVRRELAWYESQSLNVNDIEAPVPEIWKKVATPEGMINSNYGWCIFSKENGDQYASVLSELKSDPTSRRGIMIYTRPSMQVDAFSGGKTDFMCTNTVQYLIRKGILTAAVNMRSNDAVFGYLNDYAWQRYVLFNLAKDLGVFAGKITWFAGSLHLYERHFFLVDHFIKTNEHSIKKSVFDAKYTRG